MFVPEARYHLGGELAISDESTDAALFTAEEAEGLPPLRVFGCLAGERGAER